MARTIKDLFPTLIEIRSPSCRFPLVSGDCWLWTGRKSSGYGVTQWKRASVSVHRLSLFLATGLYGEAACHKCDVPACCNPTHLFWGSDEDNWIDCLKWVLVKVPRTLRDLDRCAAFEALSRRCKSQLVVRYGLNEDVYVTKEEKIMITRGKCRGGKRQHRRRDYRQHA